MDGRNDEGTEEEQIEDRQEHEEEDTEEQQDEGAEDSDPEIAIQNIIMAPKLTELLPEKFSGKDEGQNAKAHLIECKNYMEHHEITTDANKIKAFNRCITGEALLWAADLKPTTYKELEEEFLKRDGKNVSRDSKFATLNNMKYKSGEPISALVHKIRELCEELEIKTDKEQFDYFKKAIPIDMKKFVMSSEPKTIKEAASKAQTYLDITEADSKEVTFGFSSLQLESEIAITCDYCKGQHSFKDCKSLESDLASGKISRRSYGDRYSRSPSYEGRRNYSKDRQYNRNRSYSRDRDRGQYNRNRSQSRDRRYGRQDYNRDRGRHARGRYQSRGRRGWHYRGRAPSRRNNGYGQYMCPCQQIQATASQCCNHHEVNGNQNF